MSDKDVERRWRGTDRAVVDAVTRNDTRASYSVAGRSDAV